MALDRCRKALAAAAGTAALLGAGAQAGERSIYLEDAAGNRIEVARLAEQDGGYRLRMHHAPFTDHFLSMRPFKCLEGPDKHWCHVPYPYENKRDISSELTDLEYDLLFLWKGSGEYGINMWNGVYYVLERDGDRLIGRLHEIDMVILSAPPDAGDLRPVGPADLEPGDLDSHWLPRLIIE